MKYIFPCYLSFFINKYTPLATSWVWSNKNYPCYLSFLFINMHLWQLPEVDKIQISFLFIFLFFFFLFFFYRYTPLATSGCRFKKTPLWCSGITEIIQSTEYLSYRSGTSWSKPHPSNVQAMQRLIHSWFSVTGWTPGDKESTEKGGGG